MEPSKTTLRLDEQRGLETLRSLNFKTQAEKTKYIANIITFLLR